MQQTRCFQPTSESKWPFHFEKCLCDIDQVVAHSQRCSFSPLRFFSLASLCYYIFPTRMTECLQTCLQTHLDLLLVAMLSVLSQGELLALLRLPDNKEIILLDALASYVWCVVSIAPVAKTRILQGSEGQSHWVSDFSRDSSLWSSLTPLLCDLKIPPRHYI